MEYDVYGNVCKRKYTKWDRIKLLRLLDPYTGLDLSQYENATQLYTTLVKQMEREVEYFSRCGSDYITQETIRLEHSKLTKIERAYYNSETLVEHKLITTIDIGIEIDSDRLNYNGSKVIYKYNDDKNRHELYIDYICDLIVDDELDNRIDKLVEETNKLIDEHNDKIDKQIKELREEKDNDSTLETQSWFTRLKNRIVKKTSTKDD